MSDAGGPTRSEDTPVRILCFAGSPRRHGNSERLLDEFVEGAKAAGAQVDIVVAASAGVVPCRGCNACSLTGECVVRDGMDAVYPLIDAADAIAVATPVYFSTVPAILKAIYDRCQPYWARRFVLGEPSRAGKRPGACLVVGGGGDPYGSGCAVTATKSVFAVLEVKLSDETLLQFTGVDSPSDIGRHPDVISRAREMGERLVRMVDKTGV